MSKSNPLVSVLLACGHWAYWQANAARNEARTCRTCLEISIAHAVFEKEWHARCRSCTWGRFTGQDQGAALRLARKHPHEAEAFYDWVEPLLRETLSPAPDADMLPLFDTLTEEAPPF